LGPWLWHFTVSRARRRIADSWLAGQLDHAEVAKLPSVAVSVETSIVELPLGTGVKSWFAVARRYELTCSLDELNTRHVVAALLSPPGPVAGTRCTPPTPPRVRSSSPRSCSQPSSAVRT